MENKTQHITDRQKWAYEWLPNSKVIVDIGSSSSALCSQLHKKAGYVVAVDVDHDALSLLHQNKIPVQPIEATGEKLPFRTNSLETVLLLDVLEHTRNEQQVIHEIYRILQPQGRLILSVPNKGLFRFLDPQNLKARFDGTFTISAMHRHYSEVEISQFLFPKFRILKKHYGGLFLYPITFALSHFIQKHFGVNWSNFLKKIGDIDNDLSWGKWSYNMILLVEKI